MSNMNNQESYSDEDEKKTELELKTVSTINKNTQIWKQNRKISKKLTGLLKIKRLIEAFKDPNSTLASSFADTMQQNSNELVATQATLRQCMQSVLRVLSYKPSSINKEQKETWDYMNKFSQAIRKAVINVNDVTAEWFGYLTRLRHGLVFFYESMANGIGTPSNSISEFQAAARDFSKFHAENSSKFHVVREQSEQAMKIILEKFNGKKAIENALNARQKFQTEYDHQIEKLKQIELEKLKQIIPINQTIAKLQGELAQYEVLLKYANNEISNLEKEQEAAAASARENDRNAEFVRNYREEKRTTNIFGWELWGYYTTVHTGDYDRYQSIADRYRDISDKASNDKAAKMEIIKLATQQKTETERNICVNRSKSSAVMKDYHAKTKQVKDNIKKATERYERAEIDIQNAIKKYSVNEHSLPEFLNAANELSQESLKALDATKNVEVAIKTFAQIVTSLCKTVYRIDTYFQRDGVNLENLIEPLNKNQFFTLRDIECDNEEEFNEYILEHIKNIANKSEIFRMKKLSYKKKKEWKKEEKLLAQSNVINLMNQVPPLSIFFPSLQVRLRFAWDMLKIKAVADNEETLRILPIEIEELEIEDEKNRQANTLKKTKQKKPKIKEPIDSSEEDGSTTDSDSDSDSSSDSSSDSEEMMLKTQTLTLRKLKDKNKAICINDEYDKMAISFDKDTWYKKLKKLLKKGAKKKVDVKLKVSSINKGKKIRYTIIDAYFDEKKKNKKQNDSDEKSSFDNSNISKNEKRKKRCILALEEVDGNIAKCLDEEFNEVHVIFDESEWGSTLKQFLHEVKGKNKEVRVKVVLRNTGKYAIINAYKDD